MLERRLLLVLGNSTGGIGRHVASVAVACGAAGYDVTVCGPASTDELFGFSVAGSRFVDLPIGLGLLANASGRRSLRALLRGSSLVHAHGLQAGVVVGLFARRLPHLHVVVSWHNAPLSTGVRRGLHVLLERIAARRAEVTIGASDDLVVRARRAGAVDARFVPVAPPPLPPPSADPASLRLSLEVGEAPVILAVGRLHRQKRFDVLVAAAARWRERVPSPVVLIAGEGPERERLQRQAAALDVDLHLLGQRSDVADLLSIADVVVLPSSWEARPLSAQEALTAGRALVATAVGGIPSLVGSAAVLIPVGDTGALASAVAQLLDDPQARHRLERQARATAARWPDAAGVAAQLMAIYAELGSRS
jgi:glycosyltransferase involved in cell wall biosynthesis